MTQPQYPTQPDPHQQPDVTQQVPQDQPEQPQPGSPYEQPPSGPGYANQPQPPTPDQGMAMAPQYSPYAPQYSPHAPQPLAPFGVDPITGLPYSDKSKLVAGLLQIFLGGLGIGRFYLGNVGMGIAQIIVVACTLGFGYLWPLIDGIMLLAGKPRDRAGRPLRP